MVVMRMVIFVLSVLAYLFIVGIAMGIIDRVEHRDGDIDVGGVIVSVFWPIVIIGILFFKIVNVPLNIGRWLGEKIEEKGWL